MKSESTILEQAMSLVDQEQSYLLKERRAYERFREHVRLATPDSADATGPSETTEQLLVAYRDEVMETLDHKMVYGDTLAESLEEELSPSIANVLLSKKPLSQRHKRDLLVATTTAIERREEFSAELDDERAALETYAEELAEVAESLEKLPLFSPQEQQLETLLVVWEVYDKLLEQCERLLERRQQQIRAAERSPSIFGEKHARNEFLYYELDTRYPVLSAIASTCEEIESRRDGKQSRQTTHSSTSVLN